MCDFVSHVHGGGPEFAVSGVLGDGQTEYRDVECEQIGDLVVSGDGDLNGNETLEMPD